VNYTRPFLQWLQPQGKRNYVLVSFAIISLIREYCVRLPIVRAGLLL
jgi:hypothetical protein